MSYLYSLAGTLAIIYIVFFNPQFGIDVTEVTNGEQLIAIRQGIGLILGMMFVTTSAILNSIENLSNKE